MWYIYTMKYYSAIKKKRKFATCSNMDGLGGHKLSDRERQILYDITYMWNLKEKS